MKPSEVMATKAAEARKRATAIVELYLEHPAHDLALAAAYTECAAMIDDYEQEVDRAGKVLADTAKELLRVLATGDPLAVVTGYPVGYIHRLRLYAALDHWDKRTATQPDEHPAPMEPH